MKKRQPYSMYSDALVLPLPVHAETSPPLLCIKPPTCSALLPAIMNSCPWTPPALSILVPGIPEVRGTAWIQISPPRAALCLAPALLFFHAPPLLSLRAPHRRERLHPAPILAYPAYPLCRASRPTPRFYSWSHFVYCAIVTLVLLKVPPLLRSSLPGLVLPAQRSLHFPPSHVNSRQGASSSVRGSIQWHFSTPRKVEFKLLFGIVGSNLVVDANRTLWQSLLPFSSSPRPGARHDTRYAGAGTPSQCALGAFSSTRSGRRAIIHRPVFATPHGRYKDVSRSVGGSPLVSSRAGCLLVRETSDSSRPELVARAARLRGSASASQPIPSVCIY
ncbi:hypothetical protein C8R44DRAFT_753893 [Mycena epipterygia]|nr:hypothetical protein C8R44DRAFT_753893 [Mycena epipterygia]